MNIVQPEVQVLIQPKSFQVASGTNYRFIYSIVQTNCSKELFPSLHEDCVPLPHGVSSRHLTIVFHILLTAFPECQALGLDTEMSFSGSHSCSPRVLGPELLVRQSMCVTLSVCIRSGIRNGICHADGLSHSPGLLCLHVCSIFTQDPVCPSFFL